MILFLGYEIFLNLLFRIDLDVSDCIIIFFKEDKFCYANT